MRFLVGMVSGIFVPGMTLSKARPSWSVGALLQLRRLFFLNRWHIQIRDVY